MDKDILKNYNWLDIIEPQYASNTAFSWQLSAILLSLLIVSFILARHFNLFVKIKIWLILRKFKSNNDTRAAAKALLRLLMLDKKADYIGNKKHIYEQHTLEFHRDNLLKTYYSNDSVNHKSILDSIKYFMSSA